MSILSFKEKSYLGVDLGRGSIKVVEMKNEKGKPQLVTYGYIEKGIDFIKDDSEDKIKQAAFYLKEVCQKSRVATSQVIASLPGFSVFSAVINLPVMPHKELVSAIYWEAKKFIPLPIEEVVLDWKILENLDSHDVQKNGNNKKNFKILLTAASRKLVKKYLELFKLANLELMSLETEVFALTRSLIGYDPSTIMICDIGAKVSDVIIVENSIPVLNRSFNIGGESITKTIASNLNIDFKRAEQFKVDIGLNSQGDGVIPKVIEDILTSIINEINYTIELYQSQGAKKIEKIILTGGSAFLPNLSSYFSEITNLKTLIGDPWSRVIYPLELKPVLEELGPRLAVAIGLAMREVV
ncbi:MAG: Uncharacterized protein Athens101410_470 [Parcubacteria group bacterium Athens1014_10]|nr:MAG: Uncharacterized protein Athens101410_470 [Parcubacteria group bacterium Athens1014_10]TSD05221.1 MAG: Uncharacterized protein Athens071412_419 [Parcubacteria group bacterium Athens0714_12]